MIPEGSAKAKLWRNIIFGVIVSTFFLWLALRDVNWSEVQQVLQDLRWQYVPLILLIWSGGLAVRAIRWHYLLSRRINWWSVFHIHNIGFLINSTLPFRIGEVTRAFLISRERVGVSGWSAASSIVVERILDVISLALILALLLPVLPLGSATASIGLAVSVVAVVSFVTLALAARNPSWVHGFVDSVSRRVAFARRLIPVQMLERVLDGLRPLTGRYDLTRIGFWTVVALVMGLLEVWSLSLLFANWPDDITVLAGLALALVGATLSIIIPFTPAGVGPFEAAVIFALGTVGVSQELSTTFAVVWHTGLVVFYAAWGVLGFVILGVSPRQVWSGTTDLGEQKAAKS